MRIKGSSILAGIAVAIFSGLSQPAYAASASNGEANLATPLGITLQAISGGGGGRGAPAAAANVEGKKNPARHVEALPFFPANQTRSGGRGTTYADADGRTLYTYDKDTAKGASACADDCAKTWPPARVAAGAKAFGLWSVITRADGTKQWAFKDKPLYTFVKDTTAGERKGDGAGDRLWHFAKFEPAADISTPYGISVEESVLANGYVLADSEGMTIYAGDASTMRAKAECAMSTCGGRWKPVAAALLANPTGDFTLLDRDDGVKQWAYKGKPLFTFGGDQIPGDAHGQAVDRKYQVAMVVGYFTPREAGVREDIARGPIVATAGGMTLYRRDTSFHQSNGHGLPGSTPGNQNVGRAMGTKACDDACLKTWRPFVAAAGALPSGYWDIYTRADGTKQWAYKGFALYTNVADKKPGDKTGNDVYDVLIADSPDQNIYDTGPVNNPSMAAMFWSYVEP